MKRIGKYLSVEQAATPLERKTGIWYVLGNTGDQLGQIAWFTRWRQYTFNPEPHTTFNRDCLLDIAKFLNDINTEHRSKVKT